MRSKRKPESGGGGGRDAVLAGMGGGGGRDGHLHGGAAELRESRAPVGANPYVRPYNL